MPGETARPHERIAMPLSDEPGAAPDIVALGIESPDVIVVGGRAAGAASAMLLARGGIRTLLIDDGSTGSYSPPTHALMRGGVLQLSRWGLLDSVVAAGTPPVKRTTVRYRDETTVMSVKPSHGVDALYAPHP